MFILMSRSNKWCSGESCGIPRWPITSDSLIFLSSSIDNYNSNLRLHGKVYSNFDDQTQGSHDFEEDGK
jgi:hypothetical protein